MSFNSNPSRVEYVVNDPTIVSYTFTFAIYEDTDIIVYQVPENETPDDDTHLLTLNTDYSVIINTDQGGNIELTAQPSVNDLIIIQRRLPINRDVEYTENGGIYSNVLNLDQNYQTYLISDFAAQEENYFKLPFSVTGVETTLPAPVPERYMRWNSDGTKIVNDTTAPTWLTDAKGWAITPIDELFTDSQGDTDYSSKHYAHYSETAWEDIRTKLDTEQTNSNTVQENIDLVTSDPYYTDIQNISNDIDSVVTTAANITDVNTFSKVYSIGVTAPTDPDNGDLWYDTNINKLKIWDGTQWGLSTADSLNVAYDFTLSTLTKDNVQEAIDELDGKVESNYTTLDTKIDTVDTDINNTLDSVNLTRADKYLADQDIAQMSYDFDGNLIKIQYNNPTDTDYEVLTYTDDNLTGIEHYVGGVLEGNSTLSYTDGTLTSVIFTEA